MATKTTTKNKKRRSTKKRPPLLRGRKLSAKLLSRRKKLTKKILRFKKSIKKKKFIVKRRQTLFITVPFGRHAKLSISFKLTKHTISKRQISNKTAKSAKHPATKRHELIITSFFMLGGFFGSIFFGLQVFASPVLPPPPISNVSPKNVATPPHTNVLPRSIPVRLMIPDIQLDTALTAVGLHQDGSLEVPTDYTVAGWYGLSPTPGEKGPAVIAGHLDNIHGTAVFWRLSELSPGSVIEILRQDGKVARFTIEKVKQVPQNDSFPTEEVYGNTDNAALRLITCGGTFNHFTQRYSDNTVVFASLLSDKPAQG